MIAQERAPETPRAQASENAWRDQHARYAAAQQREIAERNAAGTAAAIVARSNWPTVRMLQTPQHIQGPAAGLVRGDIVGLPPELAEAFVKYSVATYKLDPDAPDAPEQIARAAEAAPQPVERYEVVTSFGFYVVGDIAGFTPRQAAPHIKAGTLRKCDRDTVRTIVGRTLDAARRALAGR